MFKRRAGEGIGLEPDVVVYMGRAAQGMPQDKGMDQRIAEGFLKAIGTFFGKPQTMEYRPERDGPLDIRPIGPYNPDTDDSGYQTLEIRNEPRRMTLGELRDFYGGMELDVGPYGRKVAEMRRQIDSGRTPGFTEMNQYGLPRDMSPEDQAEVLRRYPL